MFWDRFVKEYLLSLQIQAKWNKTTRSLTINDMVLVKDDNFTRLQWKLGRVIEFYTGRDGVVCSAKIKLSETTLIRPAKLEKFKISSMFCDMLWSYSEY